MVEERGNRRASEGELSELELIVGDDRLESLELLGELGPEAAHELTKLIIVLREELELEVVGADGFDEEEDTLLSPQGLGEELHRLQGESELEDLSVGVSDQPGLILMRSRGIHDSVSVSILLDFLRRYILAAPGRRGDVAVEVEKEDFSQGRSSAVSHRQDHKAPETPPP